MNTMERIVPKSKHVLDFSVESTSVPEFMSGRLSLMVGAGDLMHNGLLNVEKFTSDVFFCNAWDMNSSFQSNIQYLEDTKYNRVICVVDYYNEVQRRRFIDAFKGRFSLIDGHDSHVPHFTVGELAELLADGGTAMNIHEKSETMLPLSDAKYFLENNYFPHTYHHWYLNGRIYKQTGRLTEEEITELQQGFIENIRATVRSTKFGLPNQISLDENILENLERMSLSELQEIATCFQYEKQMPLNMKGRICMNMRSWKDTSYLEIVMTKTPFFDSIVTNLDNNERVDRIIEAIRLDMENGYIFGQCAKYKTLLKVLNKI